MLEIIKVEEKHRRREDENLREDRTIKNHLGDLRDL
jgi:hypothetical protein